MTEQTLEDGLVLRTISAGYTSDAEQLPDFYVRIFGDDGDTHPERHARWTLDLLSGHHPSVTMDDIWCVVDTTQNDKLVSALLLLPQTWCYEDVPFGVGRVELVATDKNYRNKRLVRRMMNALHERSVSSGHLVQSITGIPAYYRRFGYGMSLPLGAASELNIAQVPKLKEGQTAKYSLRPATAQDAPNITRWSKEQAEDALLSAVRDEAGWRYEIDGKSEGSTVKADLFIIQQHAPAQDVGYIIVRTFAGFPHIQVFSYMVSKASSYLDTFDDVMRELVTYGERIHAQADDKPKNILFETAVPESVEMLVRKTNGLLYPFPYAWYLRVPDLGAWMHRIAPVLERRLEGSAAHRFTGEVKFNFYDFTGLLMRFEDGKLKAATHGKIDFKQGVNGGFPDNSFLNVIFGKNSVDELRAVYADCWVDKTGQIAVDTLFPKKRSLIYPIA